MDISKLLASSKKKYQSKIGNIYLLSQSSHGDSANSNLDESDKLGNKFFLEMQRCLQATPNVIRCEQALDDTPCRGLLSLEKNVTTNEKYAGIAPLQINYFDFKAVWPRKNQDIPASCHGHIIEEFNILYNGSIFMAFGECFSIDTDMPPWDFGLEARKIITTCFEKSELWNISSIGPIMLHPSIYFIFLESDAELTLPTSIFHNHKLYIFSQYETDELCEEFIKAFFHSSRRIIDEYHISLIARSHALDFFIKFYNTFGVLPKFHKSLVNMSIINPLNIFRRISCTNKIRNHIRDLYELYVDFMSLQREIEQDRNKLTLELKETPLLEPLGQYLDSNLSDACKFELSPVLQGIRFFEDETRSVMSERSNLVSALIGAIIGSAIYAIINLLL